MTGTVKVLLVDDREENLLALEASLRRPDVVLLKARSGRAALELLLEHEVAVALVDVQMPEMDGFDLAELMRGSARTRGIPIIFVTAGQHDTSRVFRGYDAGGVDFLFKPLEPHILRGKVDVFVQLHRQRRQVEEQVRELQLAQARLEEADRRKDDFLAVLSHELRNPLTPIRNSIFILQHAVPGGEQARRAEQVIDRQTSHLARLVDDLLDVTRISRGKVRLQRERVDLSELARRTLEDHRPGFAAAGVTLEAVIADAPLVAIVDPTRIAQALGNLLQNAAKFTTRGGRVEVAAHAEEGAAVLRVRDDGVGISPELLGRLFEPFAQADRTLDRSQGGLGLGLALVKGLIELHGGTVSATSDGPGRGAAFELRLELAEAVAAAARPTDAAAARRGRRVLVIEDSHDTADTLREALQMMGHEVQVANDGPSGIRLAQESRPEVVLCDIGLPGMDGYEVARTLRADPDLDGIVLVALTGYASPDDQRRAEEAGFAHHVAKPATLERLDRVVGGA
ncbi:MAG TPA: response regulator [Polyangia bacterium]